LAAVVSVLWFGLRVARGLRRVVPDGAPNRRADRRLAAIAVTVVSIAALGGLLALAARSGSSPAPVPVTPVLGLSPQAADEVRQRFDQGVVMLHAKRYDHALTAFHRVLQLAPEMPEAHVNLGYALLGQGRNKEAADFFATAIELKRGQLNAYYGLAVALEESGDLAGAVGAMRTYVHLAQADDPFRRKAEAALWEWEATLREQSSARK